MIEDPEKTVRPEPRPTDRSPDAEFLGTDRFQLLGRLGSGTSGDVYRAFDRRLKTHIALKTLQRATPAAIYNFKREFRSLADVLHRNLVQLYELLSDDGERWFFTMELIEGHDFLTFVRGDQTADGNGIPEPSPPPDSKLLRDSLRQLAQGLEALHQAGKLHCDIKPHNIRVTHDGRVVLLDFGLVQELFPSQLDRTTEAELIGTPAYMSPEQACGERLTEATDWYAVGTVLYESLTGRRPFYGSFFKVLQDKQRIEPPSPQELVPELPPDLTELTRDLLRRDPSQRPGGGRVLRRLGVAKGRTLDTHRSSLSGAEAALMGREGDLEALDESLRRSLAGATVVAYVHGSSGMGKSALIRQFLKKVRHEHEEAVVLTGRCYERESVPYKALDTLVDALGRYLMNLPKDEVDVLMPTNVQALARLFPALRRIQAVVRAERQVLRIPDNRELKRRARTAFRNFFERLAARGPLVLHIDDLQWGDTDSTDLLLELLRPPDPPPMLLICSYRSEEQDTSPLLTELRSSALVREATTAREIRLEELGPEAATQLALHLLGDRTEVHRAVARTIGEESGGNPFFVAELVRYALLGGAAGEDSSDVRLEIDSSGMTLERLIDVRLGELPTEATRLLQVVAVAGQPLDLEVALQVAELGSAAQTAITALRAAAMIRIRRSRAFEEIETYHNRIGELVILNLDQPSRAHYHGSLALALEATGRADPETLASHFHEAGDREREARFVINAADQANEALAFDRAARLYRSALDLEEHSPLPRRELLIKLGDALTNAGRGSEAADAYLAAVPGGQAAEVLELKRRAAEQQLLSGHIDEGMKTMTMVLESIGMKMPRNTLENFGALALRRLQLKLRGLRYQERDSSQISPDQLIRIDTCRSVATGLGNVSPITGMVFGTRHLLLALKAGEPYRLARALAIEAGYSSVDGTKARGRTASLTREAMTLAERVNEPSALALATLMAGLADSLEGRFARGRELLARSEIIFRDNCTGVTWELDTVVFYRLRFMIYLGQAKALAEELPAIMKDFMERGDLYAETSLRSIVGWFVRLASDRPQEALEEIRLARHSWSQHDFHLQHYLQLTGRVDIALYQGRGLAAWEAIQSSWKALVRAQLLFIQLTWAETYQMRSRAQLGAAIAVGPGSEEGRKLLHGASRDSRKLERHSHPISKPWAHLVQAGIATVRGDKNRALDQLVSAAAGFDAFDMALYAAVARRRRGQLVGGAEGRRFVAEAESWMTAQGMPDPERISDAYGPGIWRST